MSKAPSEAQHRSAKAALLQFQKQIARPERARKGWLSRAWLGLLFCASVPAVFALMASALIPPGTPLAELTAAEVALLTPTDESAAKQAALDKLASEARAYANYRHDLAILGALGLFLPFLLGALVAQVTLVQRHWSDFVKGPNANTESAPLDGTVLAAVILVAVSTGAVFNSHLPGETLSAIPIAAKIMAVLIVSLLLTLAFVTIMGAYIVGGNYPTVLAAQRIEDIFREAREKCDVSSSINVLEYAFIAPIDPEESADQVALAAIPIKSPPKSSSTETDAGLLIDRDLTPKESVDIINAVCLLLAVAFVLAIGVLSFVGGGLVTALGLPEAAATYVMEAVDGWVLFVGLGASLTLAVAYVPPMLRLLPFLDAVDALSPPTPPPAGPRPPWRAKGKLGLTGVDLKIDREKQKKTAPEPDVFKVHGPAIGVSREKFRTILLAARYGGAFHELTRETLTKHITSVLTIIAPAAAGGVLSLLG